MSEQFTVDEVSKHNTKSNVWMTIHNKVYNVTKFLDDHPGGEEVLMEHAGVDATDSFEEIGHSDDARKLLKDFLVGTIVGTKTGKDEVMTKKPNSAPPPPNNQGMLVAMVPIVAIISFIAYKQIYG